MALLAVEEMATLTMYSTIRAGADVKFLTAYAPNSSTGAASRGNALESRTRAGLQGNDLLANEVLRIAKSYPQ
jgi:hypothetical protein